jgi:hypothetical protein
LTFGISFSARSNVRRRTCHPKCEEPSGPQGGLAPARTNTQKATQWPGTKSPHRVRMAYGVGAISVGKQLFIGIDVSKVRLAAAGQNRRPIGPACTLLSVAAGGEPSDAAVVWRHAEGRKRCRASGIGGLQSVANLGDEIGRQRDKCPIARSKKRRFQVLYANARQSWSVALWKGAPGSNPGLKFAFANPWCRYDF